MKGDLPMYVRDIITTKMARGYKRATKREKSKILDSIQSICGFKNKQEGGMVEMIIPVNPLYF